jgi:hypothetical protein
MATYKSIRYNTPLSNGSSQVLLQKITASSDSTISFTSGIDSTYKEYLFIYVNLHPSADNKTFLFNVSADGGSNYNVTKTTTHFRAIHGEGGSPATVNYNTSDDIAQGTGFQNLYGGSGADNDQAICGEFHLFNPSDTTFVKHFYGVSQGAHSDNYSINNFVNGYANTTSAINAIQFKFASDNIDTGTISMYGIN